MPAAANSKPYARASLICVGLMFVLPFLQPYHRLPIAGFYSEWLADKLALVARAVRFAPLPAVCYRYALLLTFAGESEAALVQLDRSLRVYPGEAEEVTKQLEVLARTHPAAFSPLVKLIASGTQLPRAR